MEKKEIRISIDKKVYLKLKNKAKKLSVPLSSYIKMKIQSI